jgi:hypothetical protein
MDDGFIRPAASAGAQYAVSAQVHRKATTSIAIWVNPSRLAGLLGGQLCHAVTG